MIVLVVGMVVYAVTLLWSTVHDQTNLTKENYVELQMSGSTATGTVRPGGTVNIAPVITNMGSINGSAFIRLKMPIVGNDPAYDYEVASAWTEVENYTEDGYAVFIYAYGSASELVALLPGESTSPLVDAGVTMRSSITGAEFNNMTDIDIQADGFLIDAEVGIVPADVWGQIPQE